LKLAIKIFASMFLVVGQVLASAIFLPEIGMDTLSAEQRTRVTDFVQTYRDEIKSQKVKLGIASDSISNLHGLLRSFITDSLEISKDAIVERFAPFWLLPSLNAPLNLARPLITELFIVSDSMRVPNFVVMLDDGNSVRNGDTVSVPEKGFALIRHNNDYRITLHPNTKVIVSASQINLIRGDLSIAPWERIFADLPARPLNIKTSKGEFAVNASAFLTLGDTSFIQLYDKTATFTSSNGESKRISAGEAIIFYENRAQIRPIPSMPQFPEEITRRVVVLPGDSVTFVNTGDFLQRLIISDAFDKKIIDTIVTADTLMLMLDYGLKRFFLQEIDTLGLFSYWSLREVNILRQHGLKSLEIFDDTLFYVTDHRFFTFRGTADTSVQIFVNFEEVALAGDGSFSHRIKLRDSLNNPDITVLYRDLSADTVSPVIFYTGFDERTTMNDTVVGLPAFTTSRSYRWQGNAPTAVNIRINGVGIDIGEDGFFTKNLRTREFINHPVIIEIEYENGNMKTFERFVERKRYMTSFEVGLKEALVSGLAAVAVASLLFSSLIGSGANR